MNLNLSIEPEETEINGGCENLSALVYSELSTDLKHVLNHIRFCKDEGVSNEGHPTQQLCKIVNEGEGRDDCCMRM